MICPACGNELTVFNTNGVKVDVCQNDGCGGIWFDNSELSRIISKKSLSLETLLKNNNSTAVNTTAKRICPICLDVDLARYAIGSGSVEIDECTSCGGIWLDGGELQKVIKSTEFGNLSEDRTIAEAIKDFIHEVLFP